MAISDRITAITNHLIDDWNSIDRLGLHTNILPKEYTQVDYIESNGTQYIDTGVNADNKLDTILDMAFTSPTSNNQNIGAILTDGSTTVRYHILCDGSQNNNFRMYTKTNYAGVGTLDANRHTFEFDCTNGKVYFDGTAYNKDTTNFDVGLNFWLFGRNSTSTKYYSNVKQYGCKMYYNNVLVRDFIPCYRNSDNEVGLYDLVNNVFYTNQGTGTFTYGEIQEQHIDKNIENIKEPLNLFYNEVSDKTDLSQNGVVGRTSQETTSISGGDEYDSPSPDYPQPINNLSGDVSYKVSGKNLWDGINKLVTVNENGDKRYGFVLSAPGKKVSVSASTWTQGLNYKFLTNGVYGSGYGMSSNTTLNVSDKVIFYEANLSQGLTIVNNLQIEISDTPTTYEPYIEPQTFTIPLGDIELCDIDTYEDKIYSNNGRFYLEKKNGKELIDENTNLTNLTVNTSTGNPNMVYAYTTYMDNKTPGGKGLCDKLINVPTVAISYNLPIEVFAITSDWAHLRFYMKKSRLNAITAQGFKDWLANNNLLIYYPLATPTTTEITTSNYPELYAALKEIQDYLTSYKINKEFILGYSSPTISY